MSEPVSPYLQRPLRSLDDALRDLGQTAGRPAAAPAGPGPIAPPATPSQQADTAMPPAGDRVTIGGQPVAIAPGSPPAAAAGGQVDVTA